MRNLLSNSLKVCAFVLSIILSGQAFAQTVQESQLNCTPAEAHCTSKDLSVVDVYVDLPPCAPCNGGTVTAPLVMVIHNGTKSERSAFALWGTLSAGASINGIFGDIFVCVGAITVKSNENLGFGPGNQAFIVGNIQFNCGQSLSLTNNLMAWTAANGSTAAACTAFAAATTCASIEPKCGDVASIQIRQPLTASSSSGTSCTNSATGSVTVTVTTGAGTAPYIITIDGTTFSAGSSRTKTPLAAGNYNWSVTDGGGCTTSGTQTVSGVFCCVSPTINASPTSTNACPGNPASFTASANDDGDPTPTIQWQEKVGAGSFTNITNGGFYSGATTGTLNISNVTGKNGNQYRAVFTSEGCPSATSDPATLTVNLLPTVDVGDAVASICQGGTTAGLDGNFGGSATGATWSDGVAGGTFNPNATTLNATYTAAANAPTTVTLTLTTSGGPCGTTFATKNLTVKAQPGDFKLIVTAQPTVCNSSATLAVCNANPNFIYSVSTNNGVTFTPHAQGSSISFNVAAGSNPQIKVDNSGCSAIADCDDIVATCPAPPGGSNRTSPVTQEVAAASPTTVKAYPNPFSDRIKFMVTSSVAGNGNLEVYNMMGQKVKTVYQGYINKGTQTFELSLPGKQVANLVYVLRIGDKKMTGKILQVNQ